MKAANIVGVKPQFVKASMVPKQIKKSNEKISICTGYYYDHKMNTIIFNKVNFFEFDYYLDFGSVS